MVNTVLIDAGPLIALFDRDDKYHRAIVNSSKIPIIVLYPLRQY